jgi:hypothetical protein
LHAGLPLALIFGMRTRALLSILLAATSGACSSSLTPSMGGTGGITTGYGGTGAIGMATGGTGGSKPGTGGVAGTTGIGICETLTAEYGSALAAAGNCQVGVSGQCQQIVGGALEGCVCPTAVTDSSALGAIQMAWQASGCAGTAKPPCGIACPAPLNTTCVATDGGTAGYCSYVPGTGGTSGAGGSPAATDAGLGSCDTLEAEYEGVLIGAESCTAGEANQCGQSVPPSLVPCGSACTVYVNDSSILDLIRRKWDDVGCGTGPINCPLLAPCPNSGHGGACLPSDAGGSVCSPIPNIDTR